MSEFLTIGELARRTGVTTSALRYYDELGLVRPSGRISGHRRYALDAVGAVGVVRLLQEAGFTLAEASHRLAQALAGRLASTCRSQVRRAAPPHRQRGGSAASD